MHAKIQPMTRKGEKNELLNLKNEARCDFLKKSFFLLRRYFPDPLGIREPFREIGAQRKRVNVLEMMGGILAGWVFRH